MRLQHRKTVQEEKVATMNTLDGITARNDGIYKYHPLGINIFQISIYLASYKASMDHGKAH